MATSVAIMARVGGCGAAEGTGLSGHGTRSIRSVSRGQTLVQSPYFRQSAPEMRWLSRVCDQMSYSSLMWMRAGRWVAALGLASLLCAAAPPPAAWVPVRWPWADTQSLELLAGTIGRAHV